MKKFIVYFLLFFSPAFATQSEQNLKWYIKGGLGVNYLNLPSHKDIDFEMNNGIFATLRLGHQFSENLHAEIESSYRDNTAYQAKMGDNITQMEGSINSFSTMLNLILDLPFHDIFILSFGAGTGIHQTRGEISYYFTNIAQGFQGLNLKIRKEGIAVHGIIGLNVKLTPRISCCGDYRYWKAPDSFQNNTLSLNLKLAF